MSTENTPIEDFEINGVEVLSRRNGTLLLVSVNDVPVVNLGGTPCSDWSPVADRVDATDLNVGDFIGVGAGMFARIVEGPRKWRHFTRVVSVERTHDFRQDGQAWRLRVAGN